MKYSYCILGIILFFSCKQKNDTLFTQISPNDTGIHFNNKIVETESSNILNNEYIFNGGGIAIADFNNDSLSDIFFTGNQVANKLYLNHGDFKFEDVSEISGIEAKDMWSTGSAIVDINNDGLLDIYVCAAMHEDENKRSNMLFVNTGDNLQGIPQFEEMAKEYGIDESRNSMGATFFDYDRDGLLDLYVLNNEQTHTLPTNYRKKIIDGTAVSNDRLYHNNGDGTFTDVTIEAGIVYEGFGLSIAITDINYDGWPDIHISNDYLTNDVFYINNTDGTFSNKIENYIKHQSQFSMGSDAADFNNDGLVDIITLDMLGETNYRMKTTIGGNNYISYNLNDRFDYEYQYMRNMLHMGNGSNIPASEIGMYAGISKTDWSWSPLFADIDNDGLRDLLITNGFPRDITDKDFGDFNLSVSQYLSPIKILDSIPEIKIPNYAYRNNGDATFEDVGDAWGINIPSFSNGAALSDLDNDGDLDYVVNNINDPAFVFKNNSINIDKKNNFLRIKLNGPKNNPMGIGAKIVVRKNSDDFLYHENYLTRGYMSSIEPIAHFGLGAFEKITSVEVLWPDGTFQKLDDISTNSIVTINHDKAIKTDYTALDYPFTPKKTTPLFKELSSEIGINYKHEEADIVDYNVQRILPHKLTQNGPCLAVGDINGDSFEDFIIGSASKYSPIMFLQNSKGQFTKKPLFSTKDERLYEEEDMLLFDLDNDGDLDLYLVSGSNEFEMGSHLYNDRLYLNDGKGNFIISNDKMPNINSSGSVVKATDFDGDGYIDLFVGGRTAISQYPFPENSYLLKNETGILKDVTDKLAPGLRKIGMVTDAIWQDFDSDGKTDLIVVGELMPITFIKNNGSKFSLIKETGIEECYGWWESIEADDIDGDGDIDLVAGNLGKNNFYQSTSDRPMTIKAFDYDNNGSIDPIAFSYFKSEDGNYNSYPVNFWGDISKQNTMFRSKFDFFKDYARATESILLNENQSKNALKLKGNYDKTSYIENLGNGKFKMHELPFKVQLGPINDMVITDVNSDGNSDLICIGNNFGNEIFVGRLDALNGQVLLGNGEGEFSSMHGTESNFIAPGDAKSLVKVKSAVGNPYYVVTQNRDSLLVFQTQ